MYGREEKFEFSRRDESIIFVCLMFGWGLKPDMCCRTMIVNLIVFDGAGVFECVTCWVSGYPGRSVGNG